MRQRFTPDIVCSTTTRTLENRVLRNFSPTLNSFPGGFFWLCGQRGCGLVALKACVFIEGGVGRVRHVCLIRGLLVVRFPWDSRTHIDHLLRVGVDHEAVLIRLGFLCAALVLLLLGGILRALAAAFRAVHLEIGAACERQRTHRHTTRVALGGFSQVAPGVWQER